MHAYTDYIDLFQEGNTEIEILEEEAEEG